MVQAVSQISLDKLPPYHLEAEQSVIGACFRAEDALSKALEILDEKDFYKAAHQTVFKNMRISFEANEPIDILGLADRMRQNNELDSVGGINYLSQLEDFVPTATAVTHHAKIVREKKILRDLIYTATEIVTNSYSESNGVEEILDQAEKSIFEISEKRTRRSFFSLKEVVKENFRSIEKLVEQPGTVTGVPTGFVDLDNKTAGLQPSDLIILAARPSMGKTSLALDIARYASLHANVSTAMFSLEMSKDQLGMRMLCAEARVNSSKLRTGYLASSDWPRLSQAGERLSSAQLFIDDSPALSSLDVRARSRRLAAEHPLGLIIIDYLQLMQSRGKTESRQLEVSEISRGLKGLAKEINVPILALSQLSRAVESRTDKRPMLSDLRESGSIEQDADVVAFIYRDEVYNPETADTGIAEILIRKQRNGPIGDVRLKFENQYTRFYNLAPGEGVASDEDEDFSE
ncbi:MAG TPA: replicative DNA helicase [Nitrospina sp.]|jgi:replicative DNA helicase|nr:replicative DNA helicase [Nitrospinota bacterium]MDP6335641.1 replicative DNA helicase [Nitrospinaceae bacterium]MDP7148741.1 replicative DNA helicase [Nitrospinaceae bacterium]HAX45704.1 replicative DNA helicase [Nitrospina sp.]|tara:strand:- start:5411 stop:6793 length:1383 start_codon:yes stop_codon:yes gene_type:complete